MLEVIVIGSGTGVPSLKRASPALVVKTYQTCILLDSGPGTLRQLLKVNIHFSNLDVILYTHLHPDHITDLIHFLFACKYTPAFTREKPVFIFGPRGFLSFYEQLEKAFGHWIAVPEDKVSLSEISSPSIWAHEDVIITPFATFHTENSQGYILQSEGKKVVYTGDTDFDESLIKVVENADLLICEASFPSNYKVEGHLTPVLAGKLAAEAKVKSLLLTHFYPECEAIDIVEECSQVYTGPLFLAQDLLFLTV
ncbi:MAG: MBL fold metallo-hydrolase [Candidatus Desulfofervidaceae bacterium]|nr:MBL fold metallo-hydrolase [Candidatus Desulfofervidaceae bacterium]